MELPLSFARMNQRYELFILFERGGNYNCVTT